MPNGREFKGCGWIILACVLFWLGLLALAVWGFTRSSATDMPVPKMTKEERADLKRWREMCKGGARYDAMREAYEKGKPQPC